MDRHTDDELEVLQTNPRYSTLVKEIQFWRNYETLLSSGHTSIKSKSHKFLFDFVVSCLADDYGNSLGLYKSRAEISDEAEVTLKLCGLTDKQIEKLKQLREV
jgi:hypothetical protein